MCGINGLVNAGAQSPELIRRMMQATAHRGPDHSSFCPVGDSIFLAGNRLKILDMTDFSNQPIWSADQKSVLIWNGALYNYQDLRNQLLIAGYSFESSSDSEVLLYWLKKNGKEGLKDLEGMYALIFVDLEKGEFLVSRDFSGEKPLYYHQKDATWFFSSEAKGILAGLEIKPEIDVSQFLPYAYYRHPWPTDSWFEGVKQVLAGEYFVLDFAGNLKNKGFVSPKSQAVGQSNEVNFEDLLKDAVLKTLHAERPVGMVLSGGVDSSLLYALWHEETGVALPCYTAVFEEKYQQKYADARFAPVLAKKYPLEHHEVHINLRFLMENWEAYIDSLDQAVGDGAGFLTWAIAKEAQKDVKVLVSGAGADELFAGYNRHLAFANRIQYPKLYSGMAKTLKNFPVLSEALSKALKAYHADPEVNFIQMAALRGIPEKYLSDFLKYYPKNLSSFKSALEWDRTFYLINDILKIHDNACMVHGIEGRAPYLEHNLLNWALGKTESDLLANKGKVLLKDALIKRGLGKIASRKKLGFGMPLKEWCSQKSFQDWIFPQIRELESNWGDHIPDDIRKLAKQPESFQGRDFLLLWNLFLLSSWLKKNS